MSNSESRVPPSDLASVPQRMPIVGIGASAGGVSALQNLFEKLPAQTGAAFVVIVHLDPGMRSELPAILASKSPMGVTQVTGTSSLEPDNIYVIPPDRELRISDHHISAVPFSEVRGHRAPIDTFFRSLADQHGDGFAVILTGAGSDGAGGVKAIKEAGGIVLVQSPNEAEYPSMPRSAIATDVADVVLPIGELADRLVELIKTKPQIDEPQIHGKEEEQFGRVLAHLRARTGHDFSHYKRSTVMRRIARRMQVSRKDTLEEYSTFLRKNADEAQALLSDLLISVTTFFRDPKAFATLARTAIPAIFANRNSEDSIRVWVAGCATGEEAYSIAILLLEEAAKHESRPEIQVFASDMDAKALAIAREGRYPMATEVDLSEERLRRFFNRDGDYYRVKRELRDVVLFAGHSILKDPPFSRLDLVSCRNLLIYLDRELQQQVISTLQYGLNPNGFLFLGSSENAEHPDGLLRVVDREARIYQSAGRPTHRLPVLPHLSGLAASVGHLHAPTEPSPISLRTAQREAHREALESLAPPSVLVDEMFRVLHLSENAGRYLLPSAGPLTSDVTELVRQELRFDLRVALSRAFERQEVSLTGVTLIKFNDHPTRVYLQVKPLAGTDKQPRRALVLFIEGGPDEELPPPKKGAAPSGKTVQKLKHELELAQTRLRTTREESEAANEELRAANEELQSINEEYRSTAEELETSKEELQSINEELQTVNSELKIKLESVSRANNDLQNLMAVADFAILFLDPKLRIKRFTPRLSGLFNITQGDIGRPITDFTHQLEYEGFAKDAKDVVEDLVSIEREVRSSGGSWYLLRFRPYRTAEDKIDGIVVTVLDVTERRRTEDALWASEQNLLQEMRLVELSRSPIFIWDFDDGITQWNRGSEELYGYSKEYALGKNKDELLRTEVPGSNFEALKKQLLRAGTWKGEIRHVSKDGRRLTVESRLELISTLEKRFVLESTRDITETKAWETRQRLLLRELTHRVKNTLTVIQSMMHQTWRNSRSPQEFMAKLDGRIAALANSHRLLVDSDWKGADLRELVESQIGSYVAENPGRLHVNGENVSLSAEIATPFGLILHELATNAAKYGALSGEKGDVDLSWQLKKRDDQAVLQVVWRERGGPAVDDKGGIGFGSRLIKAGLPGSVVHHETPPEGVRCTIEIPLNGGRDASGG